MIGSVHCDARYMRTALLIILLPPLSLFFTSEIVGQGDVELPSPPYEKTWHRKCRVGPKYKILD